MNRDKALVLFETERHFYLHRAKYECRAKLDNLNEIKKVYEPNTRAYVQAWSEWIITAKIYTAIKKMKGAQK